MSEKATSKLSVKAIVSFILALALCIILISITILNRVSVEKLQMEQLITDKGQKAYEQISHLLYKTQTLSSILVQTNGEIGNFDLVGASIVDDPTILNILIAPDGKVTQVYPLEGNESVIGLDFFAEGAGNKEAITAVETGQLVFGGPFDLVQGGQALVGRLPVYMDTPDGEKELWGIVSVTLKYPQALDRIGLNELRAEGFAYEIWRISPDTGERQVIASSGYEYNERTRYIDKPVKILNADWYFRIMPVRAWYEYPESWVLIFLSICLSLLVGLVMQNNSELSAMKLKFEYLSQTDPLTGISNRRHFIELASAQFDRSARLNSDSYIITFDIDHFKEINDKYGHPVGDKVLEGIASRAKTSIRPYDIFARYGGEEFMLFVSDICREDVQSLVERIRLSLYEPPIEADGALISVTASFGIAQATPVNDLATAIQYADRALYTAKEGGRNQSVFYEQDDNPA